MDNQNITVAVVQASSLVCNLQANLDKTRDLTSEAKKKGAKLVLFPEAFISGYPHGCDFGAKIGFRTSKGREEYLEYWNSSIKVPSPATEYLSQIAAENNVYLVIGVVEQDLGTLYCSVLFFSPEGKYLGKHRKLVPTASERIIWGFGDGTTLPVIDTKIGKIGAVICWENYMPLLRTHMYSKGIQIYCAPTADDREEWISTMRHIAMEGRCFVLSCCQYLQKSDYPASMNIYDKKELLMRGGSCIINPLGQILIGPNYEGECILTAKINLDEIIKTKYDLDVVGHYSRPDIFKLFVNDNYE
jgi:nitrilase